MLDVKHCSGCKDDFYNGHNPHGVKECWMREKATLVARLLIHVDQPPPYKSKPKQVPNCYRMDRHVTVKPEDLDANGFWRMA